MYDRVRYMAISNIFQPIPIFIASLWRRKLDYAKILQVKYFTGENILIYSTLTIPAFLEP